MTEAVIDDVFSSFVGEIVGKAPGKVLYTKVWGSYSHGTQIEGSDVDFLAVYQWPLPAVLSMEHPDETIVHENLDYQAHEIGKFCSLLMKGNPATVECLFTEQWQRMDREFESLVALRQQFINAHTLEQYIGYGDGQLRRLLAGTRLHSKGGGYNSKWAYHLIRVAYDALRIARGEAPTVMKTGKELATLMSIRRNEWTPKEVEETFNEIKGQVDALKPWPIPEAADADTVNNWLYDLRMGRRFP